MFIMIGSNKSWKIWSTVLGNILPQMIYYQFATNHEFDFAFIIVCNRIILKISYLHGKTCTVNVRCDRSNWKINHSFYYLTWTIRNIFDTLLIIQGLLVLGLLDFKIWRNFFQNQGGLEKLTADLQQFRVYLLYVWIYETITQMFCTL